MFRYAQIDENGYVVSDSFLSGEVNAENMIQITNDFDLKNKKYVGNKWVEYVPEIDEETSNAESEPDYGENILAELLLGQAEIAAKQNEHDEVLAAILLGQQTV